MKWNNKIRIQRKDVEDEDNTEEENEELYDSLGSDIIYDPEMAEKLYDNKKNGYKQLSLMKQENIRMAIKEKADIEQLNDTVETRCGYCFKFYRKCKECPLYKINDNECYHLPEYKNMENSKTIKEFSERHKAWCEKLGLWKKEWE